MVQTANGGKEELQGCVEYLELEVGGVKTYAYVFVVQSALYQLLLGRLSGPMGQSWIPLRGYEVKDKENLTEFSL